MPTTQPSSGPAFRVDYEVNDDTSSDEDDLSIVILRGPVTEDPNETIRDVNLNVVLSSLFYRITPLYRDLGNIILGNRGPGNTSLILRKLQMIRDLLLSIQYLALARQTPIQYPGHVIPTTFGNPTFQNNTP